MRDTTYPVRHKRTEPDAFGWRYVGNPEEGKDCRALCTIEQEGMVYVGIAAWHHQAQCWMQNNAPMTARVTAWQPLLQPATGHWINGLFYVAKNASPRSTGAADVGEDK